MIERHVELDAAEHLLEVRVGRYSRQAGLPVQPVARHV